MSDSENDMFPSNMYTFRQESSTISAKGPHINKTLSNSNLRSNMLSSTMLMPKNIGRQGFCEPSFYQNAMNGRREMSPTSLRSMPTMPRPNYNDSYSHRNNYTQRSVIRGASPMSVCSLNSNASISAVDIAMALKHSQFNNYDMRIIKDAYNNFLKSRSRRRIAKRLKKRFRCERRQSHDSGEQGSNSSQSSEDCRSIKTTTYRDNVSSRRSTRTDLSYFKQSLKESNIYKDCSENIRQSKIKNTFSTGPRSINGDMFLNTHNNIGQMQFKAPRSVCNESHIRNAPVPVLKDRFKGSNNFTLPSQRFNSSLATKTILENRNNGKFVQTKHTASNKKMQQVVSYQTDSDEDDIQPQYIQKDIRYITNKVSTPQRKRILDSNEGTPNSKKRNKNVTPKKTEKQIQMNTLSPSKANNTEFEFVKPIFPITKPLNGKTKEKLISKSALPIMIQDETSLPTKTAESNEIHLDIQNENQYTSSDVTMRPSFIKRKLFSQKLDVTEAKNPSDIALNSPQVNSYTGLMKEKSKARKVVANQSCLSRDTTVNNNLLDLIHKIVPPERMNMTNQINVTNASVTTKTNEKDATDPEDKWDVTSIISTCNKSNVSDTFTDEEIFTFNTKTTKTIIQKPVETDNISKYLESKSNKNKSTSEDTNPAKNNKEKIKEIAKKKDYSLCKVVIENVSNNTLNNSNMKTKVSKNESNKLVTNYADKFFETDYETDSESKTQNEKAAARDIKVVIKKPITKPSPLSKTPQKKKNIVKKLSPVPSKLEGKKKPGLKNYFQRILKGKNKENVANQEPLAVDIIEIKMGKQDTNECIYNNNYVEKVKQIQDIAKKASSQTRKKVTSTTKKDEAQINVDVNRETVHEKLGDLTILNNTKSRRIRTPKIHNLTLNLSDKPKQKRNKTLNQKDETINIKNKTSNQKDETTSIKKPRGRPRKVDTSQISVVKQDNTKNESNLSLNSSMTLRARKKQNNTSQISVVKQNNAKNESNRSLNCSMILRERNKQNNNNKNIKEKTIFKKPNVNTSKNRKVLNTRLGVFEKQ